MSRAFDELLNRAPHRQAPYVGESAFATKAGIHASAIVKEPETYEHVPPDSVGNQRRVLVSDQAGKANLIAELKRIGIMVERDDPRLDPLLAEVKEREAQGYAYDGADASFELLARRMFGGVPQFFDVESYKVMVEQRHNAAGRARDRLGGGGQGGGRRRALPVGRGGQWPDQRPRPGAAQGSRPIPGA